MLVAHFNEGRPQRVLDVPVSPLQASQALWAVDGSVVYEGSEGFMQFRPHLGNERIAMVRGRTIRKAEPTDPMSHKSLSARVGCGLGQRQCVHEPRGPIQDRKEVPHTSAVRKWSTNINHQVREAIWQHRSMGRWWANGFVGFDSLAGMASIHKF